MKQARIPFPILLLAATLVFPAGSHAALLAHYAMTADGAALNGALNVNPTTAAANVTATTMVNQAGGGPAGSFTYNGGTDRVSSWAATTGASGAGFSFAVADGNFITLSVTPAAGYEMDLSSISFQVASGSTSTTSNRGFYLVSEMLPSSFSASSPVLLSDRTGAGGGTIPVQASTVNNTIPKDYSADLSAMPAFTATRYFRFYIQVPTAAQALTFDDIQLNGTITAAPEPGGLLLCGLGSLLLIRRRVNRFAHESDFHRIAGSPTGGRRFRTAPWPNGQ